MGGKQLVRTGGLKATQGQRDTVRLLLPLGMFGQPEFLRDLAVQLIQISLVDPVTDRRQALFKSHLLGNTLFPKLPRVLAQAILQLPQNIIGNVDALQDLGQLLSQCLLPHIRQLAFPPVPGAVVIDVLPFLDFGGYGAFVEGARQQARKSKRVLLHPGTIKAVQDFVGLLEDSGLDKHRMCAPIFIPIPHKESAVKRIS